MPESPMKEHVLGIAARYNDAECEEHGFKEVIERQGLTLEDVLYISEQRALRVLWIDSGHDMDIFQSRKPVPMHLSPQERQRFITLQSAIVDGILTGWRARGLQDGA